jgi:hypothetical protein
LTDALLAINNSCWYIVVTALGYVGYCTCFLLEIIYNLFKHGLHMQENGITASETPGSFLDLLVFVILVFKLQIVLLSNLFL